MRVEELKNNKEWETFLQTSSDGTFFHSLEWKEVIEKSFSYSPVYLVAKEINGAVVGICPGFTLNFGPLKAYVSMPHSDYGGPVIDKNYFQKASLSLWIFLKRFCSDKDIAYAKISFMNDRLGRFFESSVGFVETGKGVMEIDLKTTPSELIWNKVFSRKTRKKIRHIDRDFSYVQEARSKSDLRDFYNLYYKNMKFIGASAYPYRIIKNMWEILYPKNLRIWLIGKEKGIGGQLVFKHGQRTYIFLVGIDRAISGQYSVFPYLIWKEIKKAEDEGYRYVSLGSTSSDPKNPHYLQKKGVGGSFFEQKLVWYPFSTSGRIIIQTRTKSVFAWKAIQHFLPTNLTKALKSTLSKLQLQS